MHPTTYKKYRLLVSYLDKHLASWKARHPDIVGAHVYYKTRGGKKINSYSLVFCVEKKNSKKDEKSNLPKYIDVAAGKRKKLRVPTDVVAVGKPELQLRPGAWIHPADIRSSSGTCGLIFPFDNNDDTNHYLLSCMHVIGYPYLEQNQTHPDTSEGSESIPVCNDDDQQIGSFRRGILNNVLDAAIARLSNEEPVNPVVPGLGLPAGIKELDQQMIPPGGYPVAIRSRSVKTSRLILCDAHCEFPPAVPGGESNRMSRLLQMDRFTIKGDSGSAIFNEDMEVVGIIVGAAGDFSYGIPIVPIAVSLGVEDLMTPNN